MSLRDNQLPVFGKFFAVPVEGGGPEGRAKDGPHRLTHVGDKRALDENQ